LIWSAYWEAVQTEVHIDPDKDKAAGIPWLDILDDDLMLLDVMREIRLEYGIIPMTAKEIHYRMMLGKPNPLRKAVMKAMRRKPTHQDFAAWLARHAWRTTGGHTLNREPGAHADLYWVTKNDD